MNKKIKITLFILVINLNIFEISQAQHSYSDTGMASYYGIRFHGKKTASGEKYDMNELTAAHKTLPFNSVVRVINLSNQKSVTVRINDRGPHIKNRIIDLSKAAAQKIGLIQAGVARVSIEVLPPEEVNKKKHTNTEKKGNISDNQKKLSGAATYDTGGLYNTEGVATQLKGYAIQLISFTDPEKADMEIKKLKAKHKNIYIEVTKVGSKKTYRILLGDYNDKVSADTDLKKLKKTGYNGLIRKF